jgi:hypothetical protein
MIHGLFFVDALMRGCADALQVSPAATIRVLIGAKRLAGRAGI